MAAFTILANEFGTNPLHTAISPFPIVFVHQILTILSDATTVERDVDELCANGVLHRLYFSPAPDDVLLARVADVESHILAEFSAMAASPEVRCARSAALSLLRAGATGTTVERRVFEAAVRAAVQGASEDAGDSPARDAGTMSTKVKVSGVPSRGKAPGQEGVAPAAKSAAVGAPSGADAAAVERLLVRSGLLGGITGTLRWTLPHGARVLKAVMAGRTAVVRALKRTRFREALWKTLEKKKYSGTSLSMAFTLRDLQGRGDLLVRESGAGRVVQLAPGVG